MTNSPKQLQAFIQYVQSVSEKENIKALPDHGWIHYQKNYC